MVLLAYRLGLRASDISGLKFSNIDFDKNRINIVQIKTQVPLSLPLTPEVKSAIQEYLAVRPASSSQSAVYTNEKDIREFRAVKILQDGRCGSDGAETWVAFFEINISK